MFISQLNRYWESDTEILPSLAGVFPDFNLYSMPTSAITDLLANQSQQNQAEL